MDIKIPVTPQANLISYQHRAVSINGTLATGPLTSKGLIETRTDSGEEGSMTVFGRARFIAGAAVARGARLQVTSGGFMTTAASGDTSVGFAEAAITSGSVGRGVFNFLTPTYHISSDGA